MFKYLVNFLFVFLIFSSFSFAKENDAQLQGQFGKDLTKVPFFMRYSFLKKNNEDWKDSTYSERKAFLRKYEANVAAEEAKQKAEAKAEADREKERAQEKKRLERQLADRLKAQQAEEKAEAKEEADRRKAMDKMTSSQQKELDRMVQSEQQAQASR